MTNRKTTNSSGTIFLYLSIVGFIIPYLAFGTWILHNGLAPQTFVHDVFVNGISTFFALDVLISAVVLISLVSRDSYLTARQRWGVILGTVCVGGSCTRQLKEMHPFFIS